MASRCVLSEGMISKPYKFFLHLVPDLENYTQMNSKPKLLFSEVLNSASIDMSGGPALCQAAPATPLRLTEALQNRVLVEGASTRQLPTRWPRSPALRFVLCPSGDGHTIRHVYGKRYPRLQIVATWVAQKIAILEFSLSRYDAVFILGTEPCQKKRKHLGSYLRQSFLPL